MRIIRSARYWSVHTHSKYSVNDALPTVADIVKKAHTLGQKGVGLTDHGNMAGSVELYTECSKHGLAPFPGSELYFVPDTEQFKADWSNKTKKAETYHLGVLAYTTPGYENLVNLSTLTHKNFFHKPRVDFAMLAQLAEDGRTAGLAVTTGCYFGYTAQMLINKGEEACKQWLATLAAWFPESVYVEVQNHHIVHEQEGWDDEVLAEALAGIAQEMGLPLVIGQDSHYIEPTDREDHEALKRLVAFGPDPDDAVFPGDGFHMVGDSWILDHHGPARFALGMEGLGDLLSRHDLHLGVLDTYTYSIPQVVPDPQRAMVQRVEAGTREKHLHQGNVLPMKYAEKLGEEFETIGASGMAGYMMLVSIVTDWLREHKVLYQTRGSAAGSLVCWLLGISTEDPIKWDLRFERFLSKDRTKPPDIDLDIAHDHREELLAFLNTRFTAHQIGSWATYSMDDEEEDEDGKGSLIVRYFSQYNKTLNDEDEKPTWEDVPLADRAMLYQLSDRKLYKGMGTNAAGIVLTSTMAEFAKLVPMAYMASRDGYVTQYAKDDIEALGLVKLDVLGSKTLTVLQRCMDNLGLDVTHLADIEYRDGPTYKLIRSGNTTGVFQLEGRTSRWGCKDLAPSHIKDVIAAMALFRPATMNSGGTKAYIKRKHGREPVPERHELIAKVTKETHGIMLYQEQVIDVLRALGMDADNLTKFLKAVKASNKDIGDAGVVIKGYQRWIDEQTRRLGMGAQDQAFLDEAIAGFAEYGFNRAHATIYGITAYRCAYLAARHPVEFHAALLAVAAGSKKESGYVLATRQRGVKILSPNINVSGATYTVDKRLAAVRRGLLSIDGIGIKSAEVLAELAPFSSVSDMVDRCPAKPISRGKEWDGEDLSTLIGVMGKLRDAGVLAGLKP